MNSELLEELLQDERRTKEIKSFIDNNLKYQNLEEFEKVGNELLKIARSHDMRISKYNISEKNYKIYQDVANKVYIGDYEGAEELKNLLNK